jgi:hypothetical protein
MERWRLGAALTVRLTSRRSQPPLALAVPLSRFTSQVGGGSAFFVRHHRAVEFYDCFRLHFVCAWLPCWIGRRHSVHGHYLSAWFRLVFHLLVSAACRLDIFPIVHQRDLEASSFIFGRIGRCRSWLLARRVSVFTMMPNKSPEPTPVSAVSSASRLTVSGPAWLSFFR